MFRTQAFAQVPIFLTKHQRCVDWANKQPQQVMLPKEALRVIECIDFVSDVGGVEEASQDVVVEVAEAEADAE